MSDEALSSRGKAAVAARREAWLTGQKEAFKAAVNGAPLETSLNILISSAMGQVAGTSRCAFFIANDEGTELTHLVGMPESYADKIGAESLACGLAVRTAEPVITPDVRNEPRWQPWLGLAEEYDYRGCWSFPVELTGGKLIGTFAMYFPEPREPSPEDLEFAHSLCATASIIIAQHRSHESLGRDLDDAKILQEVSSLLIKDGKGAELYAKVMDAAMKITRADFASIQLLDVDEGELDLIAWRNFHPKSAEYWQRVSIKTGTACGSALAHGERVVIPDVDLDATLEGTESLREYRRSRIKAVQSTPLATREGRVIGMISTHWRAIHTPEQRELHLIDILARQAADFIERHRAIQDLQMSERHANTLLAELQHRVRNTLAVIRSIARRTADNSASVSEMVDHFQGRLDAFSRVQAALTRSADARVDLTALVEDELLAHAAQDGKQVRIDGPEVSLEQKTAERMSLAIHELTTNAVKHGALINGHGQIRVSWQNGGDRLLLRWEETGVNLRSRRIRREGFGMELLRRLLPYDLNAQTTVELRPNTGLFFELDMPYPNGRDHDARQMT